jgi:gluconate kinase
MLILFSSKALKKYVSHQKINKRTMKWIENKDFWNDENIFKIVSDFDKEKWLKRLTRTKISIFEWNENVWKRISKSFH